MTEIDETHLPGIGVRREFATRGGDRIGVIVTRSGRRDLLLYDRADPDTCRSVVPLELQESDTLADLLGQDRIVDAALSLQRIEGLAIDWVAVDPTSPVAGRRIGDEQVRTRTGASIAAVIDGDDAEPAPGPDHVLAPGALVVAVGSPEAVARLASLFGPA